jgi:hypothetical protein
MTPQRDSLTNKVRCMVRQHPEWKTSYIAEQLACDPRFVSTVRSRMKNGYDIMSKIRRAAQRLEGQLLSEEFP